MQCTFHGNQAPFGSNISSDCAGHVTAAGCIVTGGAGGEGAYVDATSTLVFTCSDVWGNEGGDWVGPIAGQLGQDGNITADPLYCDPANGDFTLAANSPCVATPGCDPMGAHPVGCVGPVDVTPALAGGLRLDPNFPNPFNPRTTIPYHVPAAGHVKLGVFALDGRLVVRLVDGPTTAGGHEVAWQGRDAAGRPVPAGSYLVRLEAGGGRAVRSVTLLK